MRGFKFIYREEELKFAKEALKLNSFTVLNYFDNSGLTHYLKKLQFDLCNEGNLCFYVDCERKEEVAAQIAERIISGCNKAELVDYMNKKKKSDITKKIIKSFVTSLDIIPFLNVGELAKSLVEAVSETTDVDLEHISDYKIEKAIINMIHYFEAYGESNIRCLLIDNASILSPVSLEFISKLMSHSLIKILFTVPYNSGSGIEAISKLSRVEFTPCEITKKFERPNDRLISGLFRCYQKEYKNEYMDIFERYERNIHIIMSCIRGFNMNFSQLDIDTVSVLKILLILDTSVKIEILERIFRKAHVITKIDNQARFTALINKLSELSFVLKDMETNVCINKNIVSTVDIHISLIEKITITRDILQVFELYRYGLTVNQLKFAVRNLDKDYSRRKSYTLFLLARQKAEGKVEQQYLDMLFSLDSKRELLEVCSMYYNLHIYDVPFIRMKQHQVFLEDRDCQILLALLRDRMHDGNYSETLCSLAESSSNIDEKCLLVAILFQAFFNDGNSNECLSILCDENSQNYYKKFSSSRNYHYLLRNVSYYFNDVRMGIDNYRYCLSKFKNSDPVNYNRTMSNFICYLMKHDANTYAKIELETKIKEVEKILEFNDSKYLYLNINYGIYLMKSNTGDPSKYFDAIIYEPGTTETPYIYAQINYALYVAKHNPVKALYMMDDIYYSSVRDSIVVPTKIFYNINRILVEYINGIENKELLNEIRNRPLRGDKAFAKRLYLNYSNKFAEGTTYSENDWNELFLPGYIFYHGFEAELLLTSLESPTSTI